MSSVLRSRQHSIGYMGDGFTGQKTQPSWTNTIKYTEGDATKEKENN